MRKTRSAVRRIERLLARDQRLDLRQRDAHRVGERQGARGRLHPNWATRQELIAKQLTQPRQIVAHRRLTDADAGGRLGYAALREQRVESHQQIEIHPR